MEGHQHKILNIAGVNVAFPFEPYEIQRRYMECVVKAAKEGKNALLESPTGTGKTLSLLCSSVGWQQSVAPLGTKIYYTSRTHVQLNQAAKEMKRTAYARVPSVVLASRTHMCLNDDVKAQSEIEDQSINRACHNATKRNACNYYKNYENKLEANMDTNKVNDIEDLYNFGRAHECCPYYASKKLAELSASVVFMPYNYLLDLSIQKSVQLKIDKSIIIIDEGHNIESALKDSASGHFTQNYLKVIQESCLALPAKLNDALNSELHGLSRSGYDPNKKKTSKMTDKEDKTNPMEELAEKLTNDKLQQVNGCAKSLQTCTDMLKFENGSYKSTKISIKSLFGKLGEAGVTFRTADAIMTTLDSMSTFWSIAGVMRPQVIARYLGAITNLSKFISLMFPPGYLTKEMFDKHVMILEEYFTIYLEIDIEESPITMSRKLVDWTMNIWCLHPKIGLDRIINSTSIEGPRSLIITSGTLAPMHQIKDELGRDFSYVKEFDHLITEKQFKVSILGHSPNGYSLVSTYDEARKPEYSKELGHTLLSLFRILPFGTLLFFPSYAMMNRVTGYWERSYTVLWNQMCIATKIFKEPRDQSKFSDEMINYKKVIDRGGRAVFLGVCRGKLSEGTNLEANHCRSVILTGLPFPSRTDPRVSETIEFHRRKGDDRNTWYQLQMKRAMGQAIGRVIRSKDDFGMLFLCDPRFPQFGLSVSKWIQKFYPKYPIDDYNKLSQDIREFFAAHNIDISDISTIDLSDASQNSAFEFDRSKRNVALVAPLSSSTSTQSSTEARGEIRSFGRENDAPKKSVDRVTEMIKSYTVDRETYQRVKSNRKSKHLETFTTKTKKFKTTDVFETLFSQGCSSARTPSDTNPSVPMVVIDLGDEPFDGSQNNISDSIKPSLIAEPKSTLQTSGAQMRAEAKCYICKNTAVRPHVINCPCARLGCYTCLKGLNNKECGVCKTKLRVKHFKQKLFNVFQKREV